MKKLRKILFIGILILSSINFVSADTDQNDVLNFALANPCIDYVSANPTSKVNLKYNKRDGSFEGTGCAGLLKALAEYSSWELGKYIPLGWTGTRDRSEFAIAVNDRGDIDWENVAFGMHSYSSQTGGWGIALMGKGMGMKRCEVKSKSKQCIYLFQEKKIVSQEAKTIASNFKRSNISVASAEEESSAPSEINVNIDLAAKITALEFLLEGANESNPAIAFALSSPCYADIAKDPDQKIILKRTTHSGWIDGEGCLSLFKALQDYSLWEINKTPISPSGWLASYPMTGKEFSVAVNERGLIDWENITFNYSPLNPKRGTIPLKQGISIDRCQVKATSKKCSTIFENDNLISEEATKLAKKYRKSNGSYMSTNEIFAEIESKQKKLEEIKEAERIELAEQNQLLSEEAIRLEEEKKRLEIENKKKAEEKKKLEAENKRIAEEEKKRKAIEEKKKEEEERKQKLIANKERQAAELFINDLLAFNSSNPNEFDILILSDLMAKSKGAIEGKWSDSIKKDFQALKEYVSSSNKFNIFIENQTLRREQELSRKIEVAQQDLINVREFLKYYLRNNLISDIAPQILEQINQLDDEIEKTDLSSLEKANKNNINFLEKNKLNKEHNKFINQVASKDQSSDVDLANIENITLDQFEFWKEASDTDFISLINLSGDAPHAVLNLDGDIVFENDFALSCFYQKMPIEDDMKYYIYDKVSDRQYLAQDRGFECQNNNLSVYDLVFFRKSDIFQEDKDYYKNLVVSLAKKEFQFYMKISEQEYKKDFLARDVISKQILNDIKNENLIGFGSIIIDNKNETLCTDVDSLLEGHKSIINALSNEFIRMGYGKSVLESSYADTEQTYVDTQRKNCGFLYADQSSLKSLVVGLDQSGIKYKVLPIWISNSYVKDRHVSILAYAQREKEELEREKQLELEKLESEGFFKTQKQNELRELNSNVVKAYLDEINREGKVFFEPETIKNTWLYETFPQLRRFFEKRFNEGWEMAEYNFSINDYGISDFKSRKISTFVTDMNFKLMHRDLGEYHSGCYTLALILDREFDRKREPKSFFCEEMNSINNYKMTHKFQSEWVVE